MRTSDLSLRRLPWPAQKILAVVALMVSFGLSSERSRGASDSADADRAWQVILEQASGPGTRSQNAEVAAAAAHNHLEKQEKYLRDFIKTFPDDPRRYSASIRLSGVLAARGRFLNQPLFNAEAAKILADLESDPITPVPVRSDVAFARVSQAMQEASGGSEAAKREELLKMARHFDTDYPGDRRMAGLLTELANLYDEQPARKKTLLDEAAARATDPTLRNRIADDLRRLGMLNRPLTLRFQPWQGETPIDLTARRGRVVVLLFWASWSMPSLHELAQLQRIAKEFAGQPVDILTISLDEDRRALAATVAAADLRWPVHCDGRGWQGELVRSLGINALPTVWVLDRKGNLLNLNARGEQTAALIRKALTP